MHDAPGGLGPPFGCIWRGPGSGHRSSRRCSGGALWGLSCASVGASRGVSVYRCSVHLGAALRMLRGGFLLRIFTPSTRPGLSNGSQAFWAEAAAVVTTSA
ncbi:unnamed protein product [Prorocentrum cordatum]|uniref:Uncharacterized protein n=1 Tax=Prorocentrum cordatum TaxID=2364126 RepID=A0ABN9UZ24_9DINO|nr:unnamed protein product [Polarella glacialis]